MEVTSNIEVLLLLQRETNENSYYKHFPWMRTEEFQMIYASQKIVLSGEIYRFEETMRDMPETTWRNN